MEEAERREGNAEAQLCRAAREKKAAADRAYYEANKERIKARVAQRRKEKHAEILAYAKKYAAENREAVNRTHRECRAKRIEQYLAMEAAYRNRRTEEERDQVRAKNRALHHASREKRLAQKRAWARQFREKGAAYQAQRRAAILRATPAWAEPLFLEEAYRLARLRTQMTGFRWEVDHDIPLVNPNVCGLHVGENLRVIPMVTNRAKGNRYFVEDCGQ